MVAMRDKPSRHERSDHSDGAMDFVKHGLGRASSNVLRATRQASRAVGSTMKEEGERVFEKQKGRAVARVDGAKKVTKQVAHALHAVKADKLATYMERMAKGVEGASQYIEDSDLQKVLEDTREVVRSHEALAAASLFLIGFALSRFLKAGASRGDEADER